MNILFLCRYNRFRSRVAEALFNHYNKDQSINVKSAGLLDYEEGYPMLAVARRVLDKIGVAYDAEIGAVQVNEKMLEWADKIYLVASDASIEGLPLEKTEQISVPDAYSTMKECEETIMQIDFFIRSIINT